MSHAEIWDDSALVDSWNDALEEYKLYHSIHAKGERVEDALHEHQAGEGSMQGQDRIRESISHAEEVVGDHASRGPEETQSQVETKPLSGQQSEENLLSGKHAANSVPRIVPAQSQPVLPQQLIGSVHDEALKSLLMSWYYAGYYTGLYEGQQQSKQEELQ